MTLDTYRAVETPEGVELGLRLAGPVVRFWAWTLDALIRGAVYMVAGTAFSILGELGIGLFLIFLFVPLDE